MINIAAHALLSANLTDRPSRRTATALRDAPACKDQPRPPETRVAAAAAAPRHGAAGNASRNRWRFSAANGEARPALERFIAAGFLKAYSARLTAFMPELMGLYDDTTLAAACGLRPAAAGALFLEQYLEHPVEQVVSRATATTASRSTIIEVGNLSVARPGYARHFVLWLTLHLQSTGMEWALFSAVPALRNNFMRLGIPMVTLGPATPERLADHVRADWGTYYDQQPQVTAVNVATAYATLCGTPCNP
jgi:Thermostable hemolysin